MTLSDLVCGAYSLKVCWQGIVKIMGASILCVMPMASHSLSPYLNLNSGNKEFCDPILVEFNKLLKKDSVIRFEPLQEGLNISNTMLKLGSGLLEYSSDDHYVNYKFFDIDNDKKDELIVQTDVSLGGKDYRTEWYVFNYEKKDLSNGAEITSILEAIGWAAGKGLNMKTLFSRPARVEKNTDSGVKLIALIRHMFPTVISFNGKQYVVLEESAVRKKRYITVNEVKEESSAHKINRLCLFKYN